MLHRAQFKVVQEYFVLGALKYRYWFTTHNQLWIYIL